MTVRWFGTLLEDPLHVAGTVLGFVAEQLGVENPSGVNRYTERRETPFGHQGGIRRAYGWRGFASAASDK